MYVSLEVYILIYIAEFNGYGGNQLYGTKGWLQNFNHGDVREPCIYFYVANGTEKSSDKKMQ